MDCARGRCCCRTARAARRTRPVRHRRGAAILSKRPATRPSHNHGWMAAADSSAGRWPSQEASAMARLSRRQGSTPAQARPPSRAALGRSPHRTVRSSESLSPSRHLHRLGSPAASVRLRSDRLAAPPSLGARSRRAVLRCPHQAPRFGRQSRPAQCQRY